MRRPSLIRYLTFWKGDAPSSPTVRRRRSSYASRPPVRFTPQQLDQLGDVIIPAGVEAPAGWHDVETPAAEPEARFLHAVDRAIDEIAAGRRRRKELASPASVTSYRRPAEAAGDRRGRTRNGPRRRPA